jgi:hypothetical protein
LLGRADAERRAGGDALGPAGRDLAELSARRDVVGQTERKGARRRRRLVGQPASPSRSRAESAAAGAAHSLVAHPAAVRVRLARVAQAKRGAYDHPG